MATRSPRWTPREERAPATRATRSAVCSQVRRLVLNAVEGPVGRVCRARRSPWVRENMRGCCWRLIRAARGIVVMGAMNEMTPPSLADRPLVFDPLSPSFIADPYPFYRRLREEAPVFRTPQGFWLLSRYEDVAFSLRDRRFGKDFAGNIARRYGGDRMDEPVIANLARTMLVLDPPDHTRLRSLVTKAFTARRVADMRPRITKLVDEQLDRVVDKGEMDVIRDLAHRLPVIVICDMLGIPEEHRAGFLLGSNVSGRVLDPAPMTREELD